MCAERFAPNDQIILLPIEPTACGRGCAEVLSENLHSVVDGAGGVGHKGNTFDTPAIVARLKEINVVDLAQVLYAIEKIIEGQFISKFITALKIIATIVKPGSTV